MKHMVFFVIFVVLVFYAAFQYDRLSCDSRWESSGITSKYSVLGGCKVQVAGKWIPEISYRAIE